MTRTQQRLGGWWRIFVVMFVLWGVFSALFAWNAQQKQEWQERSLWLGWQIEDCKAFPEVPRDVKVLQARIDQAREANLPTEVLEKCQHDVDQLTKAEWIWPWWQVWVLWSVMWLVPAMILLIIVGTGRWVISGFKVG